MLRMMAQSVSRISIKEASFELILTSFKLSVVSRGSSDSSVVIIGSILKSNHHQQIILVQICETLYIETDLNIKY